MTQLISRISRESATFNFTVTWSKTRDRSGATKRKWSSRNPGEKHSIENSSIELLWEFRNEEKVRIIIGDDGDMIPVAPAVVFKKMPWETNGRRALKIRKKR